MRFNLDTNNLANVLDRSTSVGKVTYNQLTLLENNEKTLDSEEEKQALIASKKKWDTWPRGERMRSSIP